jgi:hypothetical protein
MAKRKFTEVGGEGMRPLTRIRKEGLKETVSRQQILLGDLT